MNRKLLSGILVIAGSLAFASAGEVLAAWSFNAITDTNAPPPAVGMGTSRVLGGLIAAIAAGTGSSDPEPASSDGAWNLSGFPSRTDTTTLAGAEFHTSTLGFRDIQILCDLRPSNTASRRVRFQYSVEGEAFRDGPIIVLTTGGAFTNRLAFDLSSQADVADNADFAFRLVSVPEDGGEYVAVNGRYSPAGTWRLDMVLVQGVALGASGPGPAPTSRPPALRFSNRLENLSRPGDAPTNTFSDLSVCPGERLEIEVAFGQPGDPGYGLALEHPEGLPPGSGWSGAVSGEPHTGVVVTRFHLEPTPDLEGRLLLLTAAAGNGAGTNRAVWRVYVPTAAERGLVLTEFLANPSPDPASPLFNPLRRDPPATRPGQHDEYLELVNFGTQPLELQGWQIRDATGLRHRFRDPWVIGAGGVLVLHGGPVSGPAPGLDVATLAAGEGIVGLSLNNDGDHVALYNAITGLVFRVVYTAEQVAAAGAGSLTRQPDGDGPWVAQASLGGPAVTPGRRADGSRFGMSGSEEGPPARLGWVRREAGGLELRWTAEATARYAVQVLENPGAWFGGWVEVAVDLVFPDGQGRYLVPVAGGRHGRFFRVARR